MLDLLTHLLWFLIAMLVLGTSWRWGQRRLNPLDDTEQQVGRQLALCWSPPHFRGKGRRLHRSLSSPRFISLSRMTFKG